MKRLALLMVFLCGTAFAATPEDRLTGVFAAVEANKLDEALKRVDALIADYPNFRLAYLVRGDLLLARTRPLEGFGNVVKTVPQDRVDVLRHRLDHATAVVRVGLDRLEDRSALREDADGAHVRSGGGTTGRRQRRQRRHRS